MTSVLATDLVPGDVLIESGIGGVSGLVTRVSVGPRFVGVWLEGEQTPHGLGLLEVCRIVRPAPGMGCWSEPRIDVLLRDGKIRRFSGIEIAALIDSHMGLTFQIDGLRARLREAGIEPHESPAG